MFSTNTGGIDRWVEEWYWEMVRTNCVFMFHHFCFIRPSSFNLQVSRLVTHPNADKHPLTTVFTSTSTEESPHEPPGIPGHLLLDDLKGAPGCSPSGVPSGVAWCVVAPGSWWKPVVAFFVPGVAFFVPGGFRFLPGRFHGSKRIQDHPPLRSPRCTAKP